jgi:conjugal transfer pilus assembly protein TraB
MAQIPIYSALSAKHKQYVHMALGGIAAVVAVMGVSGMIGGPQTIKGRGGADNPKPKSLAAVPGQALNSEDSWIGGAGKDVARMREDLRVQAEQAKARSDEQARVNKVLADELKALREGARMLPTPAASAPATAVATGAGAASSVAASRIAPSQPGASGASRNGGPASPGPTAFAKLPAGSNPIRLPAPNGSTAYPPGTPNGATGPAPQDFAAPPQVVRVSLRSAAATNADAAPSAPGDKARAGAAGGAGANNGPRGPATRHVDSFLPVSFTRAKLLGGLAAPTGGQSQSNPVPVLLRLIDLAVLPNGFRSQVQDCLVVGEGFGDQSAERAYLRTTLLSCVLKDGQVVEVPMKGSVFGEDGMNGMKGTLVTKQGAILTNALLAGIASGIGQGFAQASQVVTVSPLGSTSTTNNSSQDILKSGLGTGVGKALDRLSQYYISLAERTFPVIEVQAGRDVDIVVTQGMQLDASIGAGLALTGDRQGDRRELLQAISDGGALD